MRILNAVAALSGLTALILFVVSSHHMQDATPEQVENLRLAATVQFVSAATGVSIAGRGGKLYMIAGALILGGALAFTAAVATHNLAHMTALLMLAPVGGVAMMLGWIVLAFAAITKRRE